MVLRRQAVAGLPVNIRRFGSHWILPFSATNIAVGDQQRPRCVPLAAYSIPSLCEVQLLTHVVRPGSEPRRIVNDSIHNRVRMHPRTKPLMPALLLHAGFVGPAGGADGSLHGFIALFRDKKQLLFG